MRYILEDDILFKKKWKQAGNTKYFAVTQIPIWCTTKQ